ncbi:outer membrane protein assembly factor BamD [Campylobacter sp. MIT 99-7217]|nr:outer membrane protein assembly factor BamD [Campylobacter sp. MIT 99-7217]
MKNAFITLLIGLFFFACSAKNSEDLYNLSAMQWYKQIIKDLQDRDLEKADLHYTSMSSEHVADALLEPVLLILAQAHIDEEEYKLADFYLEEYAKKFGSSKNLDFIRYMQIKAKFESFTQPYRDQALLLEGLKQIENFSQNYPQTQFEPLMSTMLTKFKLAVFVLDENIASLYKRIGKDESYAVYEERLANSEFKDSNIIKPKISWYRRIFE